MAYNTKIYAIINIGEKGTGTMTNMNDEDIVASTPS
jgi:hypothetical protein